MNTEQLNTASLGSTVVAYGNVLLVSEALLSISLLRGNVGTSILMRGSSHSYSALSSLMLTSIFLRDGVSSSSKLGGYAIQIPQDTQYNTGALSIASFTITLSIKSCTVALATGTPPQDI